MQIKRISFVDNQNVSLKGIEIFLGPTETRILRSLWSRPKSLKDLHEEFIRDVNAKSLAYSTVHTDLTRMIDKGLVRKSVNGADVIYRPIHKNENAFIADMLRQLDKVLQDNFDVTLNYA